MKEECDNCKYFALVLNEFSKMAFERTASVRESSHRHGFL